MVYHETYNNHKVLGKLEQDYSYIIQHLRIPFFISCIQQQWLISFLPNCSVRILDGGSTVFVFRAPCNCILLPPPLTGFKNPWKSPLIQQCAWDFKHTDHSFGLDKDYYTSPEEKLYSSFLKVHRRSLDIRTSFVQSLKVYRHLRCFLNY